MVAVGCTLEAEKDGKHDSIGHGYSDARELFPVPSVSRLLALPRKGHLFRAGRRLVGKDSAELVPAAGNITGETSEARPGVGVRKV